jgi:hypothetical protein
MSDFVVRIDTAKLNAKQAAAIASAIQGAVLAELGALDLAHPAESAALTAAAGPVGLGSIIFHPEWRGLWIRNIRDLQAPGQTILTVQAH